MLCIQAHKQKSVDDLNPVVIDPNHVAMFQIKNFPLLTPIASELFYDYVVIEPNHVGNNAMQCLNHSML